MGIEREYNDPEWQNIDIDEMAPHEAYNRGFYRALQWVLEYMEKDDDELQRALECTEQDSDA